MNNSVTVDAVEETKCGFCISITNSMTISHGFLWLRKSTVRHVMQVVVVEGVRPFFKSNGSQLEWTWNIYGDTPSWEQVAIALRAFGAEHDEPEILRLAGIWNDEIAQEWEKRRIMASFID